MKTGANMYGQERRMVTFDDLRIETRQDGAAHIVGHAAVFNQLSQDLGGFREQVAPGAFARTIREDDIRALHNHNTDFVLGRNQSGTLTLEEDDTGLAIDIDAPDTQVARDVIVSIGRGDISQMSFGFTVRAGGQTFDQDEEGNVIRTLSDVQLFDVSPVTFPAYPQTDVAVRSFEGWRQDAADEAAADLPTDGAEATARMRALRDSVFMKTKKGADWFEVRDGAESEEGLDMRTVDDPVEIRIHDAIGPYGSDSREFVSVLNALKGRSLRIGINSPGGVVMDGCVIHNALRAHGRPVHTIVEGLAASMASVVAISGSRVVMNDLSFMMIHKATSCVWDNSDEMRAQADRLDKMNLAIARQYARKCGRPVGEFLEMMADETWFTADEAKAIGLVDEIIQGDMPNIRHHNLSQFRNVPDALREVRRAQFRKAKRARSRRLMETRLAS